MTTHADLGIDEATFAASLRVIDHPWRAGQRCEGCSNFVRYTETGRNDFAIAYRTDHIEHTIPIPAVTDELLMRMLREGTNRWGASFFDDYINYWSRLPNSSIDAAIVRAAAALDKEG